MTDTALLDVRGIHGSYGSSKVLFGMTLQIAAGEIVTLLGRNGMGKTTTVNSIMGMHPVDAGVVRFRGEDITRRPSYFIARLGVGLVPEGRQAFANLSVRENLLATAIRRKNDPLSWHLDSVYALFPRLKERQQQLGGTLSGGEQQMLVIARALMTNPRLLILDEATEGLAPRIRSEIWQCLASLKRAGLALLIIDKNIGPLLRLADRHYIVERGAVVWHGTSDELRRNPQLAETYVGVQ